MTDLEMLQAILRNDFGTFLGKCFHELNAGQKLEGNWHIDTIAHHLSDVERGHLNRLIVNLPPRHLKSQIISVAYVAWMLGRHPEKRIICVSYADDLARSFSRQTRQIMESSWFRELFPACRLSRKKQTENFILTTKGGFRLATSTGGTLTGKGGDMIIIDDPLKPADALSDAERNKCNAWYDHTLYSRLDSKVDGSIILIMQRLHEDDLTGHVKESDNWTHISIPAIAEEETVYQTGEHSTYVREEGEVLHPEREPMSVLEGIKERTGSLVFEAQYNQNPLPREGNFFKRKWIKYYDCLPSRFDCVVQSWDTASKDGEFNDYSVCTTWGLRNGTYYLRHVFRDKLEYPDLRKKVLELHDTWEADFVLIEDANSGTQLIQDLRRSTPLKPLSRKIEGDKITRAYAQTAKVEAGQTLLPEDAPWLDEFLKEVTAFPSGKHDDQVDSMTQFLKWAEFYLTRLEGKRRREEHDRRLRQMYDRGPHTAGTGRRRLRQQGFNLARLGFEGPWD